MIKYVTLERRNRRLKRELETLRNEMDEKDYRLNVLKRKLIQGVTEKMGSGHLVDAIAGLLNV